MRITVIHNPSAGDGRVSRELLLRAIHDVGYETSYQSTKADDFPSALQEPGDAVMVAGGDGTVRRVVLELRGTDVPVAVLPLGVANNVAGTLGIRGGLDDCIRRIRNGQVYRMDIGVSEGPWGERRFIEGVGLGAIAEHIRVAEKFGCEIPEEQGRTARLEYSRQIMTSLMALLPSFECTLTIGDSRRELRLLMLQVMNVQRIGPALPLAPLADAADGMFDVVWVEETERAQLQDTLRSWAAGEHAESAGDRAGRASYRPKGGHARAAQLHVTCAAPLAHLDDSIWRAKKRHRAGYDISFGCEKGALSLLL
ncbi:diacylglycerol kinase family lipid kinase [soil metagenome]